MTWLMDFEIKPHESELSTIEKASQNFIQVCIYKFNYTHLSDSLDPDYLE